MQGGSVDGGADGGWIGGGRSYLPLLRNQGGNSNIRLVRGPAARCSSHLS